MRVCRLFLLEPFVHVHQEAKPSHLTSFHGARTQARTLEAARVEVRDEQLAELAHAPGQAVDFLRVHGPHDVQPEGPLLRGRWGLYCVVLDG